MLILETIHHKPLGGGGLIQIGPLKVLTLIRGHFYREIEFTWFSMGMTHNFHGTRGAENFSGLKGGGAKKFVILFASSSPYKCL